MSMLPFLKHKRPRVARPEESQLPEQKLIHGSSDEHMVDHCAQEMIHAYNQGDHIAMKDAFKALILAIQEMDREQDHAVEAGA